MVAEKDGADVEQMMPVVYEQLRALAGSYARSPGSPVDPTSLVHEAYLRLSRDGAFADREHFCAVAALAMRQVLVDRARRRSAEKRGGGWEKVTLSALVSDGAPVLDVIAVDEALEELARLDSRQARIVELRIFGGLTVPQIAGQLEVSASTVEKEWRRARAWLGARLGEG